jgi:hypothetical protein
MMTSNYYDDESWKTPELRAAEDALEGSVAKADKVVKELELKEARGPIPPPLASPERVAAIKAAAESAGAAPHLRVLASKVRSGDLTWEDALTGKAFADPEIQAAMSGQLDKTAALFTEYKSGTTLDEILEVNAQATRLHANPNWDDDEDDGYQILRQEDW